MYILLLYTVAVVEGIRCDLSCRTDTISTADGWQPPGGAVWI